MISFCAPTFNFCPEYSRSPLTRTIVRGKSTFTYHGLPTSGLCPDDASGIPSEIAQADQVKILIKDFLENINFDCSSPFIKDRGLESAVWDYLNSRGVGEKTETSVRRTLKLSVTYTHQAYTALPSKPKSCVPHNSYICS